MSFDMSMARVERNGNNEKTRTNRLGTNIGTNNWWTKLTVSVRTTVIGFSLVLTRKCRRAFAQSEFVSVTIRSIGRRVRTRTISGSYHIDHFVIPARQGFPGVPNGLRNAHVNHTSRRYARTIVVRRSQHPPPTTHRRCTRCVIIIMNSDTRMRSNNTTNVRKTQRNTVDHNLCVGIIIMYYNYNDDDGDDDIAPVFTPVTWYELTDVDGLWTAT